MLCRELIEKLEELAPKSLACDWDNPGFLAGRGDKEIKKVLVALDATDRVVEQAVREQADLLLTHHPLIFRALKQVNDTNFISRRIVTLLQADISYFAMHTNFDAAPGCMADLAAKRLGIRDGYPLEVTGEVSGVPVGIGKTAGCAGRTGEAGLWPSVCACLWKQCGKRTGQPHSSITRSRWQHDPLCTGTESAGTDYRRYRSS